jgi:hypothetical protein
MTVKEQFNIAGLPTTWGDPKFKGWQPEADALVVQRLHEQAHGQKRNGSIRTECRASVGTAVRQRVLCLPSVDRTEPIDIIRRRHFYV